MRVVLFLLLSLKSPVSYTQGDKHPWEWIDHPEFSKAYQNALEGKFRPFWVRALDGPSNLSTELMIKGEKWYCIQSCKSHDCSRKNMTVLYQPETQKISGLLYTEGSNTEFFGMVSNNMKVIRTSSFGHRVK